MGELQSEGHHQQQTPLRLHRSHTGRVDLPHPQSRADGMLNCLNGTDLGETGPLSQGVQAGRKALRIRHINGMEVRKKRPRGFKKRPRGFK